MILLMIGHKMRKRFVRFQFDCNPDSTGLPKAGAGVRRGRQKVEGRGQEPEREGRRQEPDPMAKKEFFFFSPTKLPFC